MSNEKFFEWSGAVTAILYSLLVASNTGLEFVGFLLLFISAGLIGWWSYIGPVSYTHLTLPTILRV